MEDSIFREGETISWFGYELEIVKKDQDSFEVRLLDPCIDGDFRKILSLDELKKGNECNY